jgi:hypothetical protein
MALYHREVFWPYRVEKQIPIGIQSLTYSKHAIREANSDRYGTIKLPVAVDMSNAYVFEAEVNQRGEVSKVVFRVQLDPQRDLVIVGIPRSTMFVKTVWVNLRTDNHKTLRKNRYVQHA